MIYNSACIAPQTCRTHSHVGGHAEPTHLKTSAFRFIIASVTMCAFSVILRYYYYIFFIFSFCSNGKTFDISTACRHICVFVRLLAEKRNRRLPLSYIILYTEFYCNNTRHICEQRERTTMV
ncbi:unnamed protein product [Aphis gossypii]|uniref:Uncharacterized protein n=1 Tax=Aphis gossypii TaxID=80765 RepID=A0A9P0JEU0_APHGO|nr:unnamed protein product [Aphis gossypii]